MIAILRYLLRQLFIRFYLRYIFGLLSYIYGNMM